MVITVRIFSMNHIGVKRSSCVISGYVSYKSSIQTTAMDSSVVSCSWHRGQLHDTAMGIHGDRLHFGQK